MACRWQEALDCEAPEEQGWGRCWESRSQKAGLRGSTRPCSLCG